MTSNITYYLNNYIMAINRKRKTNLLIAFERLQKVELKAIAKMQNLSQAELVRRIIQDFLLKFNTENNDQA